MIIAGPTENINIKTNKVIAINEEIGMVPVLAFGNITGDFSMMEYTLKNDKYKSKCFMEKVPILGLNFMEKVPFSGLNSMEKVTILTSKKLQNVYNLP